MKTFVKCSLFFLFCNAIEHPQAIGQAIQNFRSVNIRYGRTGLSGDIFKLQTEYYLMDNINLGLGGFVETSNRNQLHYNCYGLDLLAHYYTPVGDRTNNQFQVKLGLGGTIDYEQENHLYKMLTTGQKINYGMAGEITGEWAFTEDFSLLLAYNQKVMFVKDLGSDRFDISIGLKLKFF
jgi:hypothetical protein